MGLLHLVVLCSIATLAASTAGPAPIVKLNTGQDFPALGLGTWLGHRKKGGHAELKTNQVQEAVEAAIDAGYRHIDTAAIYGTEEQVGRGINKKLADGTIKREEIFVTTKVWSDQHAKEAVVPALRSSLVKLGLEYVDMYLIHWPVPVSAANNSIITDVDYLETWEGMVEALNEGLTKSIGVSNFNQQQLERIISLNSVVPVALQVEVNLNLQQPALRAFCREHNIAVTGYTPFGSLFYSKAAEDAPPPRVDDPELVKIAKKYSKTVPQVTLRYLVELGVVPIPKSITKSRIVQNLDVFDFQLTQQERDLLKSYDKAYRTLSSKKWISSPYYPFEK